MASTSTGPPRVQTVAAGQLPHGHTSCGSTTGSSTRAAKRSAKCMQSGAGAGGAAPGASAANTSLRRRLPSGSDSEGGDEDDAPAASSLSASCSAGRGHSASAGATPRGSSAEPVAAAKLSGDGKRPCPGALAHVSCGARPAMLAALKASDSVNTVTTRSFSALISMLLAA